MERLLKHEPSVLCAVRDLHDVTVKRLVEQRPAGIIAVELAVKSAVDFAHAAFPNKRLDPLVPGLLA